MSRKEEKYRAADDYWNTYGCSDRGKKIIYKLGFFEGFDFADAMTEKDCKQLEEENDDGIIGDMIETIRKEKKEFPSSAIAAKADAWIAYLEKYSS